jgi:hypothetical protein
MCRDDLIRRIWIMKRFLGALGLGVVIASQAIASSALEPGQFVITTDAAQARAVHQATVRSGACLLPAISVDQNGVWLVHCSGPDRNGGDPAATSSN